MSGCLCVSVFLCVCSSYVPVLDVFHQKLAYLSLRKLKAVHGLLQLVEDFPLTDPQEESLQDKMQMIRAKFKQASIM